MPPNLFDAVTMTINLEPAAGWGSLGIISPHGMGNNFPRWDHVPRGSDGGDTPPAADGEFPRHGACSGSDWRDGGEGSARRDGASAPGGAWVSLGASSGFSTTPPTSLRMAPPPPRARAARSGWRCGVRTSEFPTHSWERDVDAEDEMLLRVPDAFSRGRHHSASDEIFSMDLN